MAARARPERILRKIVKEGTTSGVALLAEGKKGRYKQPPSPLSKGIDVSKPTLTRRNLTECVRVAMQGDPLDQLDPEIPLHRLAQKIATELSGEETEVWKQHRLLELFWDRTEGRVPEVLESTVTVKGVIALPVVTSSAMDWSRDAVDVLNARRSAIDVQALPPAPDPSSDGDD